MFVLRNVIWDLQSVLVRIRSEGMFRGFRPRTDRLQNLVFAIVVGVGSGAYIFKQDSLKIPSKEVK